MASQKDSRSSRKIFVPALVLGVFLTAAVLWLMGSPSGDEAAAPVRPGARAAAPVKVITRAVEKSPNDRTFKAVGSGRARLSVDILPQVSEEVMAVYFSAQDRVAKDDILVQLDDREEKLAVRLAEVNIKDSRSLLSRYEKAVKEGAVPESEVDAARAAFEGAQVALEQAQLDLEKRQIRAPFDGVVGIPNVDPGDRVGLDSFITGLDDRRILHVDFEVPEALVGALRGARGDRTPVTVTTPAYPGQVFTGYISAQESRVDPSRRTLLARASIDNAADLFRPGMSFETIWEIAGEAHVTIPEIALQWSREGAFLWVVRNGRARKVTGRVIARKAGRVLLDAPITEGELVVIEGVQRLRDGAAVEVLGQTNINQANNNPVEMKNTAGSAE